MAVEAPEAVQAVVAVDSNIRRTLVSSQHTRQPLVSSGCLTIYQAARHCLTDAGPEPAPAGDCITLVP